MGSVSLGTAGKPQSLPQTTKTEGEAPVQPVNSMTNEQTAATKDIQPTQNSDHYVVERENLQASYDYDKQLKQIIITLRRGDTGETVRQIPSEHIVRMLQSAAESLDNLVDVKG